MEPVEKDEESPVRTAPTPSTPAWTFNSHVRARSSSGGSGLRASPYAMASRSSPSPRTRRLPSISLGSSSAISPGSREMRKTSADSMVADDAIENTATTLRKRSSGRTESPQSTEGIADAMDENGRSEREASANNGSSSEGSSNTPPFGMSARSLGLRRGIARRGAGMSVSYSGWVIDFCAADRRTVTPQPRDKSMLRVAATLQDESSPFAGELASEARLSTQRRLATSSNERPFSSGGKVLGFTIPSNVRARHQPPFIAAGSSKQGTRRAWEEQDEEQTDVLDDVNFGVDSGDLSSDDDNVPATTTPSLGATTTVDEMDMDDLPMDSDSNAQGAPILGASAQSLSNTNAKWTDFRETRHFSISGGSGMIYTSRLSASPSAERSLTRGRTPGFAPASYGASEGMEMSEDPAGATMKWQAMGNHVGRAQKRKAADDRFEPYTVTAHKRRAVSPMHQLTLSIPPTAASMPVGPPVSSSSPRSSSGAPVGSYFAGAHTTSFTQTSREIGSHHHHHARNNSKVSLGGSRPTSRSSSPALGTTMGGTSTRPSTPTTSMMPPPVSSPGVVPVSSAMTTTASSGGTPKMATTPGAGSGPGYGSGALGLSLGLNHSLYSSPGTSTGIGTGIPPRGLGVGGVWTRRDRDEEMNEDVVEEGLSAIGLE